MNKKTKLSIYLAKEGVSDDSDILKEFFLAKRIIKEKDYNVYLDCVNEHEPDWAVFLKPIHLTGLSISSSRVVVIKKIFINNSFRYFVLTFGLCQSFFKDDVFEEQFGLKIILNTLESNQIRHISKRSIGSNQKSSQEQLPKGSDIFEFGFDIERDLIKSVAGKNDNDNSILGKRMLYGSNVFSFSTEYSFMKLDELLITLFDKYSETKYKERFNWIDNIKEVKNKVLKQKLDSTLLTKIKNGDSNIWMAPPETISWEKINGFAIEGDRDNIYPDIEMDKIISLIKKELTSIDQLKHKEIRAVSIEDDNDYIYRWSAYKCVVANISFDGDEYCISDGKWYKINSLFVETINRDYEKIKICDEPFIDYNYATEDEYNHFLHESLPNSIEMHKSGLITLQGKSKAEPCDVFYNKKIIHIKKNGGSSYLSHLFAQAANCTYIWGTTEGRRKLKNKNRELDLSNFINSDYEIVAAIINTSDTERPVIPFFSKITACYVARELELRNFNFSLKNIHDISPKKPRQRTKKSVKNKESDASE